MRFNTEHTGKKRQMIFLPEVNPKSLLLFFEKGNSGSSWSIRDYSAPNRVSERYAYEFGCTANEIRARAKYTFDAPISNTNDLNFWHEYTQEGNNRILGIDKTVAEATHSTTAIVSEAPPSESDFPILQLAELRSSSKASKRGDLDRILHSPNSEDYVTWNWVCLIKQQENTKWWGSLLELVRKANPSLDFPLDPADVPEINLWERVPSPTGYETASRQRMRDSSNRTWIERARNSRPVEGVSEIDLSFTGLDFIIFVEAKLGSDISLRTTYDPQRDQVTRNIDCLLERADGRQPYFWMFARDKSSHRAYVQLLTEFQGRPESLCSLLPHRKPDELRRVCQNLTIVLWRDLLQLVPAASKDALSSSVLHEVSSRV